jgi:hypothetical protein
MCVCFGINLWYARTQHAAGDEWAQGISASLGGDDHGFKAPQDHLLILAAYLGFTFDYREGMEAFTQGIEL